MEECPIPDEEIAHLVPQLVVLHQQQEGRNQYGCDWNTWVMRDPYHQISEGVKEWWNTLPQKERIAHCDKYLKRYKEKYLHVLGYVAEDASKCLHTLLEQTKGILHDEV